MKGKHTGFPVENARLNIFMMNKVHIRMKAAVRDSVPVYYRDKYPRKIFPNQSGKQIVGQYLLDSGKVIIFASLNDF